jgi:hypothetical protein
MKSDYLNKLNWQQAFYQLLPVNATAIRQCSTNAHRTRQLLDNQIHHPIMRTSTFLIRMPLAFHQFKLWISFFLVGLTASFLGKVWTTVQREKGHKPGT